MKTLFVVFGLIAAAGFGQDLHVRYVTASAEIQQEAYQAYTNAVHQQAQQAQQRGDLDTLQVALKELQSVQTSRTFRASSAPASLQGFATALERQTIRRQYDLTVQYSRALQSLEVLKTRQGDVAGAIEVRNECEAARFILAELSSQIPPEPVVASQTNQVEVAPRLTKPHQTDIGEKMLGKWSINGGWFEMLPDGEVNNPWGVPGCNWKVNGNVLIVDTGEHSHRIMLTGTNTARCVRDDGVVLKMKKL